MHLWEITILLHPVHLPISASLPTKVASTTHSVHELIRRRWSPRSFTSQPITTEEVLTLFEAATWAASASNSQPWVFVYAHRADAANFQRLLDCLVPANQAWAQHAAVLVLALARTVQPNGKPNEWARHDVGAATTTLLLQATAMGLHGHVMGGFDADKTRQAFRLPPEVVPVTFAALGHQGAPENLEEPNRTRETASRTRKTVSEIAFVDVPTF